MRSTRRHFVSTLAAAPLGVALGTRLTHAMSAGPLKVAFAYVGTVGTLGWNFTHERARRQIAAQYREAIHTISVENVAEGRAGIPQFRAMIRDGASLIFATTYGFSDAVFALSSDHPSVRFQHCTGLRTADNVSTYAAATWQSAYLAGVLAAESTRTGVLGIVGAVPIPEVLRAINGFSIGALSANSKVEIRLRWVNEWWNPVAESSATEVLLRNGADCIFPTTNSEQPLLVCERSGAYCFGMDSDMSHVSPKAHLASVTLDWEPYYSSVVRRALAGNWTRESVSLGASEGVVALTSISPKVSAETIRLLQVVADTLKAQPDLVWRGPISSWDGNLRVRAGATLSRSDLERMNWLHEGIIPASE